VTTTLTLSNVAGQEAVYTQKFSIQVPAKPTFSSAVSDGNITPGIASTVFTLPAITDGLYTPT